MLCLWTGHLLCTLFCDLARSRRRYPPHLTTPYQHIYTPHTQLTHTTNHTQELAVVALLSYLSYLLADVSGLSAILSLFVCGVVVSHYALHNVSPEGRHATLTSFQTASHLAEGLIFLYLGMDCLDPLKWQVGLVCVCGVFVDVCVCVCVERLGGRERGQM